MSRFDPARSALNQRVDPGRRARAQALMSLMTAGVGNLIGYLGSGWWFSTCAQPTGPRWSLFWGGLATMAGVVLIYFQIAYHGRGKKPASGATG